MHALYSGPAREVHSRYPYMQQLAKLQSFKPRQAEEMPGELSQITTPLKVQAWREGLQHHPDANFSQYVIQGISEGFRIGFNREITLKPCAKNMLSAVQLPHIVSDYLQHEREENRIALAPQTFESQIHISAFGVIPKQNKPGKWRLIVDLSAPEGFSVNDGIQKDLCSLTYMSVEDVV